MSKHTLHPLIWLARASTRYSVLSGTPALRTSGAELLHRFQSARDDDRGVLHPWLHDGPPIFCASAGHRPGVWGVYGYDT